MRTFPNTIFDPLGPPYKIPPRVPITSSTSSLMANPGNSSSPPPSLTPIHTNPSSPDALLELASLQDLSFFIDTVQKYAIDDDLLLCISFLLHLSDDYTCNLSYFVADWDTMRSGERIVRLDEIEMMKKRFHGEHWDPLMAIIARRCLEEKMKMREKILTYEEATQMLGIAPMSVFRLV
jgi:hypothetical protein